MSPERIPNPISLEEIISNAKELMLRDGKHIPVLIVEADSRLVAGQISYMPATHGERVELMHHLGQATAKSGRVKQLQQVFMVQEGWMGVAIEDEPLAMRPSQDPNRKEVLIVSGIQIKERKKHWYVIQENGITLFGPHPSTLIPKISKDEYMEWVKKQTNLWQDRIDDFDHKTTGSVAYAIYTMCRAMYAARYGRQVSKNHAIAWAKNEFPQWASLLELAKDWRKRQWDTKKEIVGSELPKVVEFVKFAINQTIHPKIINT